MREYRNLYAAPIVSLLLVAIPVHAQLSSASLVGAVRDPSGGASVGARLVLRNNDTSVEMRAETNSSGNYVLLNIPPGNYTLEASASGFQTTRVSPLALVVNQTATVDLTLQIGGVQQTMTIQAAGELLQAATSELGGVVQEKQVVDLPLNGRNFTQLLALTPGVAPISVSQNSGGFGNVASGTSFSFPAINGQTNRSNLFLTDGLNNQGAFQSTYAVPPIIDAISEFKVNSHDDQAEFGMVLGVPLMSLLSRAVTTSMVPRGSSCATTSSTRVIRSCPTHLCSGKTNSASRWEGPSGSRSCTTAATKPSFLLPTRVSNTSGRQTRFFIFQPTPN